MGLGALWDGLCLEILARTICVARTVEMGLILANKSETMAAVAIWRIPRLSVQLCGKLTGAPHEDLWSLPSKQRYFM